MKAISLEIEIRCVNARYAWKSRRDSPLSFADCLLEWDTVICSTDSAEQNWQCFAKVTAHRLYECLQAMSERTHKDSNEITFDL